MKRNVIKRVWAWMLVACMLFTMVPAFAEDEGPEIFNETAPEATTEEASPAETEAAPEEPAEPEADAEVAPVEEPEAEETLAPEADAVTGGPEMAEPPADFEPAAEDNGVLLAADATAVPTYTSGANEVHKATCKYVIAAANGETDSEQIKTKFAEDKVKHYTVEGRVLRESDCVNNQTKVQMMLCDSCGEGAYENKGYVHPSTTLEVIREANCLEDEVVAEKCTACGRYTLTNETTKPTKEGAPEAWEKMTLKGTATGHNWVKDTTAQEKAATCTKEGYIKWVCSNKGCNTKAGTVGNDDDDATKAPTELEDQGEWKDAVAGTQKPTPATYEQKPATLKHETEEIQQEAIKNTLGDQYNCYKAEEVFTRNIYKCQKCGQLFSAANQTDEDTNLITPDKDAAAHKAETANGNLVYDFDTTTPTAPKHTARCKLCGWTGAAAPCEAGGTSDPKDVVEVEGTCKTAEVTKHTCKVCGNTWKTTAPLNTSAHKMEAQPIEGSAPTCTKSGLGREVCSVCGATGNYVYMPRSHEWVKDKTISEATCTKRAVVRYICKNYPDTCDGVYEGDGSDPSAKTGELPWKEVEEGTYAPHGEATGAFPGECGQPMLYGTYCPTCFQPKAGTTPEEIAGSVTEHQWETKLEKAATCTEDGQMTGTCKLCGAKFEEVEKDEATLKALGHDWENKLVETYDCTVGTVLTETCNRCGVVSTEANKGDKDINGDPVWQKMDDTKVDKANHTVGSANVKVVSNNDGTHTITCTNKSEDGVPCSYKVIVACDMQKEGQNAPADCKHPEREVEKCKNCGYTTYKNVPGSVPNKKNHVGAKVNPVEGTDYTLEAFDGQEATCLKAGVGTKRCACGDVLSYTTISKRHVWAETVQQAQTCGQDGIILRTCTVPGCAGKLSTDGDDVKVVDGRATMTVTKPATGLHKYTVTDSSEPTCTEPGAVGKFCEVCGKADPSQSSITQPALGHDYQPVGEPEDPHDCMKPTIVHEQCTRCGAKHDAEIPGIGKHVWDGIDVQVEPVVCGKNIQVVQHCMVCGQPSPERDTGVKGDRESHSWKKNADGIVYAEVVRDEKTGQPIGHNLVCEYCGATAIRYHMVPDTEQYNRGDGANNNKNQNCTVEVSGSATCTMKKGAIHYTCERCGINEWFVPDTAEGDPKAGEHPDKPGDYTVQAIPGNEPDCYKTGVGRKICKFCGETYGYVAMPKEHQFGDWQTVTEPTCGKAGSEKQVCALCGTTVTRKIAATGKHAELVESISPEGDVAFKFCPVCGYYETLQFVGGDASDAKNSLLTSKCQGTGKKDDKPTGQHNLVSVPGKEATETSDGYSAGVRCSRCGFVASGLKTVKKHTHVKAEVPEIENQKEPTCTEDGGFDQVFYCAEENCDYVMESTHTTLPAKGHSFAQKDFDINDPKNQTEENKFVRDTEPKCTEVGKGHYVCTVCGESSEPVDIAALGHTFDRDGFEIDDPKNQTGEHWAEDTTADCETEGEGHYVCGDCGASSKAVTIPKKSETGTHTWSEWEDDPEDETKEVRKCDVCGKSESRDKNTCEHVAGEMKVENEVKPDCIHDGSHDEVVRCTLCDAIMTSEHKVDPAIGHSWDNGVVTTEPTEEHDGVKTFTCTNDNCPGFDETEGADNKGATAENEAGKATKTEPIEYTGGFEEYSATLTEDGTIRETPKNSGKLIDWVDAGTAVTITGELVNNFYPVRMEDGTEGYINMSYFTVA